ncbi:hypothetical protein Tco_0876633 [Tanacetum coccineum]|uniref:Uncharacterized protein n=1 Tax=Tanacetum coccineum TaxID=301880 RepID=A0ABQ5BVT1_9ASTR
MEILLEPTSNKLMVEHAEFDDSNANVLEIFYTLARNPVKEILLKLNLPDHMSILTDLKEQIKMEMERRSVKVKELRERCIITAFKLSNQERSRMMATVNKYSQGPCICGSINAMTRWGYDLRQQHVDVPQMGNSDACLSGRCLESS